VLFCVLCNKIQDLFLSLGEHIFIIPENKPKVIHSHILEIWGEMW